MADEKREETTTEPVKAAPKKPRKSRTSARRKPAAKPPVQSVMEGVDEAPKPRPKRVRKRTQEDVVRAAFKSAPVSVKDALVAGLGLPGGDLLTLNATDGNVAIMAAFTEWAVAFSAEYREDARVRDNKVQTAVTALATERGMSVDYLFYNRKAIRTLALLLREVSGNAGIFALQAAAAELK